MNEIVWKSIFLSNALEAPTKRALNSFKSTNRAENPLTAACAACAIGGCIMRELAKSDQKIACDRAAENAFFVFDKRRVANSSFSTPLFRKPPTS